MAKKDNARNNQRSRASGSTNKKPSSSSGNNRDRTSNRGEGGKLDDVTYNVITVLHKKSEGLEAYEQYLEDAEGNEEVYAIFEELRDQDQQAVSRLQDCLRNLMGGGAEREEEEEEVA